MMGEMSGRSLSEIDHAWAKVVIVLIITKRGVLIITKGVLILDRVVSARLLSKGLAYENTYTASYAVHFSRNWNKQN